MNLASDPADQTARPSWLPGPIVGAPMAGGISTPALVAAVSSAGGLGFLAAGYLTPQQLGEQIDQVRELGVGHFGVNLFVPATDPVDPAAVAAFGQQLLAADPRSAGLGTPQPDDDHWQAKLDLLLSTHVPVVSFTFGLPSARVVSALADQGSVLLATVTSGEEAAAAAALGVDGLVVQSAEAGGHRASFDPAAEPDPRPLIDLVQAVAQVTALPLIAAGGIVAPGQVEEVLQAGAVAAQVGTALMLTPEAGTAKLHRAALVDPDFEQTVVTRAFTGRPARSLRNAWATQLDPVAVTGYPQVRQLAAPVAAAAAAAGDPQWLSLWAGTGWRQIRPEAAVAVNRLQAMQLVVRRATVADAPGYTACREQSMREAYAHFMPEEFFQHRAERFDLEVAEYSTQLRERERQVQAGERPFHDFWLAEGPDGQILGIATVGQGPADWEAGLDVPPAAARQELAQLYTLASTHGTGLADRLLHAALPASGPGGDDSVYLWVMADNPRAERFYLRRGFVPDGVRVPTGESWFGKPMLRMVRPG